jgi:hypothetical protein
LNDEKVHSVPVVDRTDGKNKILGLVDVMDICSFVTNQYYQKQYVEGWDLKNFKYIIEASLNNQSASDLIGMLRAVDPLRLTGRSVRQQSLETPAQ